MSHIRVDETIHWQVIIKRGILFASNHEMYFLENNTLDKG